MNGDRDYLGHIRTRLPDIRNMHGNNRIRSIKDVGIALRGH